jgi:outer membrane protein assembly factor BamB
MLRVGSFALLALSFALPLSASPWPRFRGPNGAGVANDKDIPIHWNHQEGVLWKIELPGLGNSSPIIWGDRLFVQSASTDGKERFLLSIHVTDGKILWSRSVPGGRGKTHAKNTLASSTPATDGERVYALFWDGNEVGLHAYDVQGQPLWHRGLGRFTSQHGAGASPIVHDGKVILANDQDGTAELLAFDAKSGEIAWQAPRQPFRACYSTPFIHQKAGQSAELIVASTAGITSYQPANGHENWSYTWMFEGMALRTVASPLYSDGLFIANSGDGSGARHLIAVKVDDKGESPKAQLVWEWSKQRPFPYVPTMLTRDKYLFFVNDHGEAGCCLAKTGEILWKEKLGGTVSASPILIQDRIYAIDEAGTVYVFQAGPTYKQLAKNNVDDTVYATPAVADNRLFIRGQRHLYCISKPADKRSTQR